MSIKLNKSSLFLRNRKTGKLQSAAMFASGADKTLDEIKEAADESLEAVEAKGQEVLEKIPDYDKRIDNKIDKPSVAPTAGEYFRIKSVNEDDGTFVGEWASLPIGSANDVGGFKTSVYYGVGADPDGFLSGIKRTKEQYDANNGSIILSKGTLENILPSKVKDNAFLIATFGSTAFSDIKNAYDNGIAVYCHSAASGKKYPLIQIVNNIAYFTGGVDFNAQATIWYVDANNKWDQTAFSFGEYIRKFQSISNAGKILEVGTDGNLTLVPKEKEWTMLQKVITEADVVDGEPKYITFNIPEGAKEFAYNFAVKRTDFDGNAAYGLNLSTTLAWDARGLWRQSDVSYSNITFRGHSEILADYIFTDTIKFQSALIKFNEENVVVNTPSNIFAPRKANYTNKLYFHSNKGIAVGSELTLWYR